MSYTPSPVDNTTGAHDTIPAPGGAGNTTTNKTPFYLSKYFWTNLAALLALIIPDVRAWLDSNPIEFFSALGAVNILLQFISGGKYQLAGEDGQSGQSANPAGVLPLPVASMGEDVAPPVEDRSQYPDQDTSSMPNGSGSSSPLSGTTPSTRALISWICSATPTWSSPPIPPTSTSIWTRSEYHERFHLHSGRRRLSP